MGWLFVLAFAVIAAVALGRFAKLPRSGFELAGAALLIGIAGYAWQGRPLQPGSPVVSREESGKQDLAAIDTRRAMSGRFNSDAEWLDFADTLNRFGKTREAVIAIRTGLRNHRNSPDLWVGLGNALVAHEDGLVSPAAEFAFQHAAQLSPEHPGPPFFLGLAMAQSGKVEEAGQIWRGLLARTPPNAPWRADLVTRLTQINGMPIGDPAAKPKG